MPALTLSIGILPSLYFSYKFGKYSSYIIMQITGKNIKESETRTLTREPHVQLISMKQPSLFRSITTQEPQLSGTHGTAHISSRDIQRYHAHHDDENN